MQLQFVDFPCCAWVILIDYTSIYLSILMLKDISIFQFEQQIVLLWTSLLLTFGAVSEGI